MTTEIQTCVDLIFPVQGSTIPREHAYPLYSAVTHAIRAVHGDADIGIFPIRGTPAGQDLLQLTEWSSLRFRIPAAKLPMLLPLAGKSLKLNGHALRVGVPHVAGLVPAPALSSPLVIIKLADAGHKDVGGIVPPTAFLAAAKKKLVEMAIHADPEIQLTHTGPRAGQPRRRVLNVKGQTHVGYAMIVQGLTAGESIRLQEKGLGGRRLMGCGLFLPIREG